MIDISIEDIFAEDNVKSAFEHLMRKHNSSGYDGVLLSDLKEYWSINKKLILEQMEQGTFQSGIITIHEIVQKNGKRRDIAILCDIDRLIFTLINRNMISAEYDIKQKRNSKVLKICRKYLTHVQKSVFEGEITESKYRWLQQELKRVIDTDEDQVAIYVFDTVRYVSKDIIGYHITTDNII